MIITAEGPKSNPAGQSRGQAFRHAHALTGQLQPARPGPLGKLPQQLLISR